jgi:hypothetical protein
VDARIGWCYDHLKVEGIGPSNMLENSGIYVAIVLYFVAVDCPVYIRTDSEDLLKENISDWMIRGRLQI